MARKINVKLILELRDAGLSRSNIASTRHMSKHSVSEVFDIAEEKGISYSDVKDMDENSVYRQFYPNKFAVETMFRNPDYEYIHQELKKTGVTLKLLWEEYKDSCQQESAIPFGYTKFCEGYGQFTIQNSLTNHLEHKPGAKCEVDWSGPTMHYVDRNTGELIKVYLFVGTLPYSQYSYVEPRLDMAMDSFLRCHIHMYDYFGGVPTRTVCDNLKTGVVKHPREGDIVLTDDYEALGLHYRTAIMPTGVRNPKQKASVEGTVGKIATAIIAKLRKETFYSFGELQKAVKIALNDFNRKSFQKREGSRYEIWNEEKKYLHALPPLPYEIAHWDYGHKVRIDFHAVYKKNYYSCPYQYAKKEVDFRITDTTLEIFHKGERIASHKLQPSYISNHYSTHQEDMPPAFRNIVPWDDERFRNWASAIGPATSDVINRIFASVPIKEQGYNPCLSVLRLSKTYSDSRLETACELAIARGIRSPRYHHINGILSANQDLLLDQIKSEETEDMPQGFVRGTDYYENGGKKHVGQ